MPLPAAGTSQQRQCRLLRAAHAYAARMLKLDRVGWFARSIVSRKVSLRALRSTTFLQPPRCTQSAFPETNSVVLVFVVFAHLHWRCLVMVTTACHCWCCCWVERGLSRICANIASARSLRRHQVAVASGEWTGRYCMAPRGVLPCLAGTTARTLVPQLERWPLLVPCRKCVACRHGWTRGARGIRVCPALQRGSTLGGERDASCLSHAPSARGVSRLS